MKLKRIFKSTRVIILLVVLLLAVVAINPHPGAEGVAIRQVEKDSAAALAGIKSPAAGSSPTSREVVTAINGQPVLDVASYYAAVSRIPPNSTFTIQTDESLYRVQMLPLLEKNPETNETKVIGTEDVGLVVYDAPINNIGKGLDLSGGTRVILQPEHTVSSEEFELIIDNIKERLNVFGLSDISVRSSSDLAGTKFIVVEIPGINKEEVRSLLGSQGVFEARIGNTTVFSGGDDVTFVCRSSECSGIDSRRGGCQPSTAGGWFCPFYFTIKLSDQAAQRQAEATRELSIVSDNGGAYLSQPLDLYLDGELVDSLNIAADLQGRAVTDIEITGSGTGTDGLSAQDDAIANKKKLQTILITGSLPVALDIVKIDAISPVLGAEFVRNAILMAFVAIIAVAAVVFVRYRKLAISVPMVITMLSEAVIILGFAALIGWNLDLASIAGIIIAIGTGVDDQIVIVDETMKGQATGRSWKERLQRAFFIIFAAFFATVVAMVPLLFAGAGLLKGFAITTIVGVAAGVFVTRPAFAATVEILLKEEE